MTIDTLAKPRRLTRGLARKKLILEVAVVAAIALFLILILPLLVSEFRLGLVGRFLALAIVALGIDLIWGFTGLLSLGHGIFFALGGYGFAMYLSLVSLPAGELPEFFSLYGVSSLPWFWQPFYSFPFTLIAIVTIPALVAGLFGYLVFRNRIRGVYFSILTQAALVVFFNFFNGQQKLINGTNGLKTSTTVFLGQQVGGAIAGVAGALYTVQSGIISPQAMDIAFSIEMVIWVAVGGRATLVGAILGAVLVNLARSLLSERFPNVWLFFQGALFLLVVTALPDGLIGWGQRQFGGILSQALGLTSWPGVYADYAETEMESDNLAEKEL
jgi:urea transport system permease protein